jgi:hypothetical protein
VGTPPSPGKQDDWSLVSSPANTGLTAPPPGAANFKPDVPGTYVFESKPGKGGGAPAAQRTLLLEVDPTEPLVCVNTRVWPAGQPTGAPEMKVGGEVFPGADATGLHVVVLDRATTGHPSPASGLPVSSTFAATDAGYAAYKTLLSQSALTSSYVVLVSGTMSSSTKDAVWGPLSKLGAVDVPLGASQRVAFSFIGIPGISNGSAWQTTNPTDEHLTGTSCGGPQLVGDRATNLSGWLTHDTTGESYTYVSPDFVDFDTDASAPSGMHAIRVGDQTYTVPTSGSYGYQALVLDRRTLCAQGTLTKCDPGPPLLNAVLGPGLGESSKLSQWTNDPDALLLLAPFTGPNGEFMAPFTTAIAALQAFGASPLAPGRAVGPAARYALVGGGMNTGLPDGSSKPIVAESFTGFGGTGHIAGTLVRDHQNRFGPREASLSGTQLDTLGEVVYGPTSAWPEAGDSAREAAFAYLSDRLGYSVGTQYPHGVRDQYLAWINASSVPNPETRLQQAWCTTDRRSDVDPAACATELHELRNEFLEVKYVDDFLDTLQKAYFEVASGQPVLTIIDKVENDITKDLTPPTAETNLALPFVNLVFHIADVIPGIGIASTIASAELDLGESLITASDGSSTDPLQKVYDTGDDLLNDADQAFSTVVKHIDAYQPLIVSDYAKLTLVGHRAATDKFQDGTDLTTTPWAFTDTDLAAARTGIEFALKQWLYPPLVDAGFPVWQVVIPSANGFNGADRTPVTYRCNGSGLGTGHPFNQEPDDGWIKLDNGTSNFYLALSGTRYSPDELAQGHHATPPDEKLLASMFGALPDNVGIDRAWYFEHYFKEQLDSGTPLTLECFPE